MKESIFTFRRKGVRALSTACQATERTKTQPLLDQALTKFQFLLRNSSKVVIHPCRILEDMLCASCGRPQTHNARWHKNHTKQSLNSTIHKRNCCNMFRVIFVLLQFLDRLSDLIILLVWPHNT